MTLTQSGCGLPSQARDVLQSLPVFFIQISAVRLPREPSNPERLKGFGYAEFDDVDSLLRALSLNEEVITSCLLAC